MIPLTPVEQKTLNRIVWFIKEFCEDPDSWEIPKPKLMSLLRKNQQDKLVKLLFEQTLNSEVDFKNKNPFLKYFAGDGAKDGEWFGQVLDEVFKTMKWNLIYEAIPYGLFNGFIKALDSYNPE